MAYRVKKIREERAVKNGWSRWVQPITRRYLLACCDCGLTHYFNFRVHKPTGRIQFQVKRSPGYTARERRMCDLLCKPVLTVNSNPEPKQRRARRRRVLSKRPKSK